MTISNHNNNNGDNTCRVSWPQSSLPRPIRFDSSTHRLASTETYDTDFPTATGRNRACAAAATKTI